MTFELWLAFTAASTALLIIPGPTVLLVLSYALSQGRRVALASAAGVALGDLIAMSASLVGLGALIATSATAFTVLKWIGAANLVFLGLQMLRSAPQKAELARAPATPPCSIFWHAAIVTALNPKSIGFFIAFVPQFLSPQSPFAGQAALLIATFVGLAAFNAFLYALAADQLHAHISRPAIIRRLTQAGGVTLIAMGAFTATLKRQMP